MKKLGSAIGLSIILVIVLYVALDNFSDISPTDIVTISLTVFCFSVWLLNEVMLRYRGQLSFSPTPRRVASLDGYGISWHVLFVYGTLALLLTFEVSGFVIAFIAARISSELLSSVTAASIATQAIGYIVAYLVGSWIGTRTFLSFVPGILLVLVTIGISRLVSIVVPFFIVPNDIFFHIQGSEPTFRLFLSILSFSILSNGVCAALGFWIGWRNRLRNYVGFLLRNIPRNTHTDFVELAYEEARRLDVSARESKR